MNMLNPTLALNAVYHCPHCKRNRVARDGQPRWIELLFCCDDGSVRSIRTWLCPACDAALNGAEVSDTEENTNG